MVFSFAGQLLAASRAAAAAGGGSSRLGRQPPLPLVCLVVLLLAAAAASAQVLDAEEEALSAKGIAGEILDTAVDHCRRGERSQAMALFEAIRDQLDPPPAILRLIDDLEATGCSRGPATVAGSGLRLQVGGGWDSNVSQGITARSLVVGSGENAIELPLDASYQPRASAFAQAAVDYSLDLPASGLNLQMGLGHRKNASERAFDLTTAFAAASREFRIRSGVLRAQLELGEVWLGGQHYQRTRAAGLQWLWTTARGTWLASWSAVDVDYLTQRTQNSLLQDAGLLFERRIDAALSVNAGLSAQYDRAKDTRPGGDRRGLQVQVGAFIQTSGWRFKPQLTYSRWLSADVFSPGLIDVRRRNASTQVLLQAEKPLAPRSSLVLEWRGRWSRDSVVLYSYRAQAFTANLVHRF